MRSSTLDLKKVPAMLHVVTILLAVGGVIPVCKSLGPLIGRECCTPETTPDRTQDLALKVDEG